MAAERRDAEREAVKADEPEAPAETPAAEPSGDSGGDA